MSYWLGDPEQRKWFRINENRRKAQEVRTSAIADVDIRWSLSSIKRKMTDEAKEKILQMMEDNGKLGTLPPSRVDTGELVARMETIIGLLQKYLEKLPGRARVELLDVKQAAGYLGVSTALLNRYKSYAVIPFVQIGSRIKFKREDLDDFIDEHRVVDMDDGWRIRQRDERRMRARAKAAKAKASTEAQPKVDPQTNSDSGDSNI